jgi:hypothetical protein
MSSSDVASCASSVTVKASNVPPPSVAPSSPLLLLNPGAMNHPHDEDDDDDDDQDRVKVLTPPTINAASLDTSQPLVRGTLVQRTSLGLSTGARRNVSTVSRFCVRDRILFMAVLARLATRHVASRFRCHALGSGGTMLLGGRVGAALAHTHGRPDSTIVQCILLSCAFQHDHDDDSDSDSDRARW